MKRDKAGALLVWLLATVAFGPARAGVYVVTATGNDGGPGMAARPFATIQKAVDAARAGDTVIVKGGLYRQAVHLHDSGTALAPIRLVADPPGAVVISGADVMTG